MVATETEIGTEKETWIGGSSREGGTPHRHRANADADADVDTAICNRVEEF